MREWQYCPRQWNRSTLEERFGCCVGSNMMNTVRYYWHRTLNVLIITYSTWIKLNRFIRQTATNFGRLWKYSLWKWAFRRIKAGPYIFVNLDTVRAGPQFVFTRNEIILHEILLFVVKNAGTWANWTGGKSEILLLLGVKCIYICSQDDYFCTWKRKKFFLAGCVCGGKQEMWSFSLTPCQPHGSCMSST